LGLLPDTENIKKTLKDTINGFMPGGMDTGDFLLILILLLVYLENDDDEILIILIVMVFLGFKEEESHQEE